MQPNDLDASIVDWVIDHPASVAIFEQLGIDYCCGGKSLRYACRERGLDAEVVLARLRLLEEEQEGSGRK